MTAASSRSEVPPSAPVTPRVDAGPISARPHLLCCRGSVSTVESWPVPAGTPSAWATAKASWLPPAAGAWGLGAPSWVLQAQRRHTRQETPSLSRNSAQSRPRRRQTTGLPRDGAAGEEEPSPRRLLSSRALQAATAAFESRIFGGSAEPDPGSRSTLKTRSGRTPQL